MKDSRDNVLATVARGVRSGTLPPGAKAEHPGAPPVLGRPSDRDSMAASFIAQLEKLSGVVHRVSSDRERRRDRARARRGARRHASPGLGRSVAAA